MIKELVEEAKNLINQDSVQVISFDIFDTLIVRPCLHSSDIIKLVAKIIFNDYQIDIEHDRLFASTEMNNPYANIKEIWEYIAQKHGCPENASIFLKCDVDIESSLMYPRYIGKLLYDIAVSTGKRIVATSDMYLTKEILRSILDQSGYEQISEIYVSCDCKAYKDSGELFNYVLNKEHIDNPCNLLHIGNSKKSDYIAPKNIGIQAFLLPKNKELFRQIYEGNALLERFHDDIYENIVYGFAVNSLFENNDLSYTNFSLYDYVCLVVFPILLHFVLFILNNNDIQKNYRNIYFLSRDGYLFYSAYNYLKQFFEKDRIEGKYCLTSRIASHCLIEETITDRLDTSLISESCSFEKFLSITIHNRSLLAKAITNIPNRVLALDVLQNRQECKSVLKELCSEVTVAFENIKLATKKYYSDLFQNDPDVLMCDCGFNGTIANNFFLGFEGKIKFDKIFLWQKDKNRKLDEKNNTKTFAPFVKKKGANTASLMETTFSEPVASCIGFTFIDSRIEPLYDSYELNKDAQSDITYIQSIALGLVQKFAKLFAKNLKHLCCNDLSIVFDFLSFYLTEIGPNAKHIFNNIKLHETYSNADSVESLGEMIINKANKHKND